ncbi:sigma-54-dependent transcriptional response regulator [Geotalea daltonii FRC-32]|uniref:Sigma-54-dependent transcriptional response regulator n=1 Tax=Geotalea daltonii (strain DSM 22248 / JCM 15807 / FRC-32) TaxID=316067 RepID=B9M3K1_GEODF|nr:sigma-54 dependent transcriptional regulator [Geotalea daltonii]ACM21422.1 sigma-54-dependent transcriptional response regulator [Geotalea daltonii FRC-32]
MNDMANKTILVIDDEENLRHMLQVMLRKKGYKVELASEGAEALRLVSQKDYDFILCDIRMPVLDGVGFLKGVDPARTESTIIMMSAYGTVDTAIECMKLGAYDYISKPFKSDEIDLVLRKAEERERLKSENRLLKEELKKEYSFANIISKNQRMRAIFTLVQKVCDFKTTVLILGESGTGKELIARAIHQNSNRRNGPFIAINCAAIPESLLESELFGHVKGAFTDASTDKVGLFEQATGGTLFLDEIGEMPLALQVKLLRVLQDEEIRVVGGAATKKIDVRVISATSKDLEKEISENRFREDLYFRLNVFTITLPPLRDRQEDIPLLINHFIAKHSSKMAKHQVQYSSEALRSLMDYNWPGNVRELENSIERALVVCEGAIISLDCLPEKIRQFHAELVVPGLANDSLSIKYAEEVIERDLIRRALERTGGNRTHAAKLLEISHRALLYKIKDYGMDD